MAAHGGTARISETPGGGLTVRLTFPPVAPSTASGGITAAEEAARVASSSETEQESKPKGKGIGRFKGSASKGSASKGSASKDSTDKSPSDKDSTDKDPTDKSPASKD